VNGVDHTIRERKLRLRASNEKKGLVQVQVWVPADRRDDLYEMARGWRKSHDNQLTWQRRMSQAERNA